MEHCPNCGGGEFKPIAAILERPVIEKILTHLGLDPKPPPRERAREAGQDFAARAMLAGRCVLVEDAIDDQKAAHALGMGTAWMQRWARSAGWGVTAATRVNRRPAYVDRRVSRLRHLARGR